MEIQVINRSYFLKIKENYEYLMTNIESITKVVIRGDEKSILIILKT